MDGEEACIYVYIHIRVRTLVRCRPVHSFLFFHFFPYPIHQHTHPTKYNGKDIFYSIPIRSRLSKIFHVHGLVFGQSHTPACHTISHGCYWRSSFLVRPSCRCVYGVERRDQLCRSATTADSTKSLRKTVLNRSRSLLSVCCREIVTLPV
jgi:hypothetical protein